MAWLRLYDELLDDPKIQFLNDADFRGWINLLCVAKRYNGRFPAVTETAFLMRMTVDAVSTLFDRLSIAGLIDTVKGGANGRAIAPHNWEKFQYKSDSSTERVKRFRNAAKTVSVTPPETETETETEVPSLRSGTDTSSLRSDVPRRRARKPVEKNTITAVENLEKVLDRDHAKAVIDHRAKLRRPLTAHAAALLAEKFRKCPDPNDAADTMIANGWQRIEAEWLENGRAGGGGYARPSNNGALAVLSEMRKREAQEEEEEDNYAGPTIEADEGSGYHEVVGKFSKPQNE